MGKYRALLGDPIDPFVMPMPVIGDCNPRGEIEVFLSIAIPSLGSQSTYDLNRRWGVISDKVFGMFFGNHDFLGVYDFRPNSLVSENFKQDAVSESSIDEVHPIDS